MSKAWSLLVREKDGKCRAMRNGKAITGWLSDAWAVIAAVRRKEPNA